MPAKLASPQSSPISQDRPTRGLTRAWDLSHVPNIPVVPEDRSADLVDRVLKARGFEDPEIQQAFIQPSLSGLHDPSLIPDLDKAAQRILTALQNKEQIVIFGDYDVDGITASSILFHMLNTLAPEQDIKTYIPHRINEGYGLNDQSIHTLADGGAKVIITVDCGITAITPAQAAKDRGIDLIITDHHNPPADLADLPDAFAVVHPRRPDSNYPFGELCGAGVAYKLAWRLATMHCDSDKVTPALRTTLVDLLAFVALGTIADVVPLIDENRVITKFGLARLPATPVQGLQALIKAAGLDSEKIDAQAIGFRLAPRLNAIGRLGHAGEALELLTVARSSRAAQLAEQLTELNDDRRKTEQAIVKQALELAEQSGMTKPDKRAIVLASEDWHPGVVGIACSRLVDRYARPAILMQLKDGIYKGSARSIEGFNIQAALESCTDHLISHGGHDMAAGLSCSEESYPKFVEQFLNIANQQIAVEDLIHKIKIDSIASINELTVEALTQFEQLAPFGAGNPRVKLLIQGARLNGRPEPFGKTGNHLSLRVADADKPKQVIRVIGWSWWEKARDIGPGSVVDLVVEPVLSRWNGRTRIEPLLSDLRVLS